MNYTRRPSSTILSFIKKNLHLRYSDKRIYINEFLPQNIRPSLLRRPKKSREQLDSTFSHAIENLRRSGRQKHNSLKRRTILLSDSRGLSMRVRHSTIGIKLFAKDSVPGLNLGFLISELDERIGPGTENAPYNRRQEVYPHLLEIPGSEGRSNSPHRVHRSARSRPGEEPHLRASEKHSGKRKKGQKKGLSAPSPHPAIMMLRTTVAPTAIPASSPTCR